MSRARSGRDLSSAWRTFVFLNEERFITGTFVMSVWARGNRRLAGCGSARGSSSAGRDSIAEHLVPACSGWSVPRSANLRVLVAEGLDYIRVTYVEPHAARGRQILAAHPELRTLAGPMPWSALWTIVL